MSKKNKLPTKLIPIEGQTKLMPEFRAKWYMKQGLAVMVNGCLRFTEDTTHLGYNTSPSIIEWRGRKSGYAGPTVLQAISRL